MALLDFLRGRGLLFLPYQILIVCLSEIEVLGQCVVLLVDCRAGFDLGPDRLYLLLDLRLGIRRPLNLMIDVINLRLDAAHSVLLLLHCSRLPQVRALLVRLRGSWLQPTRESTWYPDSRWLDCGVLSPAPSGASQFLSTITSG